MDTATKDSVRRRPPRSTHAGGDVDSNDASDDHRPASQRRFGRVGFVYPVHTEEEKEEEKEEEEGEEKEEEISFTVGDEEQSPLDDDDDAFRSSTSSNPISIPSSSSTTSSHATDPLPDAFFTPPRMYMMNLRHFSVGAVPGFFPADASYMMPTGSDGVILRGGSFSPRARGSNSSGDRPRSPTHAGPADRPRPHVVIPQVRSCRERSRSEVFPPPSSIRGQRLSVSDAGQHGPLNRRDRSHSAPSILTPAQRQCAEELRRISDEFDRFYHSMDHDRDTGSNRNTRPASFPRLRQRNLTTWWQNVVQVFRPSRPSPQSPIEETAGDSPAAEEHDLQL